MWGWEPIPRSKDEKHASQTEASAQGPSLPSD